MMSGRLLEERIPTSHFILSATDGTSPGECYSQGFAPQKVSTTCTVSIVTARIRFVTLDCIHYLRVWTEGVQQARTRLINNSFTEGL